MAFAREIFIRIKQVIRFQQSNKESDSHYTLYVEIHWLEF